MTSPLANLADQTAELLATISGLATIEELRDAEPSITGKRSILSALQKSFGALAPEDRKEAGAQLQEARRVVEVALEHKPCSQTVWT
jgi:phenylalanyl-tRNA synthetase alpha chain